MSNISLYDAIIEYFESNSNFNVSRRKGDTNLGEWDLWVLPNGKEKDVPILCNKTKVVLTLDHTIDIEDPDFFKKLEENIVELSGRTDIYFTNNGSMNTETVTADVSGSDNDSFAINLGWFTIINKVVK